MIFTPSDSELKQINLIHQYNEMDYTILRISQTMVDKNIIDANAILRDLLAKYHLVDYSTLDNGGKNGKVLDALFLSGTLDKKLKVKCYKVSNSRSDPRFSIEKIVKQVSSQFFKVGDLLYISIYYDDNGQPQLIFINLSTADLNQQLLLEVYGLSKTDEAFNRLLPQIQNLVALGYHKSIAGSGKVSPKDAGDTLEHLLGIDTNNSRNADFEDSIEIKSKVGKTLDTLFTLRPQFENTHVAEYEQNDRSRVSAFTRLYGYYSDTHPNMKSLYVTIGTEDNPQNKQDLFLRINEESRTVELRKHLPNTSSELVGYWRFDDLETTLQNKHPATLWIKADYRYDEDNVAEFRYFEVELSRSPQFTTFLTLIQRGIITYDWRGYTTPEGKYSGKNHGNAWRIKKGFKDQLFGILEKISFE